MHEMPQVLSVASEDSGLGSASVIHKEGICF